MEYFLSADWGTTHLRLRWVHNTSPLKVLHEIQSPLGIKSLHTTLLQATPNPTPAQQAQHFQTHFLQLVKTFLESLPPSFSTFSTFSSSPNPLSNPLPIYLSGMASANIGWLPLPYAHTPISASGSQLQTHPLSFTLPLHPCPLPCKLTLISGVQTDKDILRGEETEIIGLLNQPNLLPSHHHLLLPGTHTKLVHIQDDCLINFQTFLTGELFDLLRSHSILQSSIIPPPASTDSSPLTSEAQNAFLKGVHLARSSPLLANLFQIRAQSVLHSAPEALNYWILSGLLIATELLSLPPLQHPLYLHASPPLSILYPLAAHALDLSLSLLAPPQPPVPLAHATLLKHSLSF